jgi:hypothetical protein
MITLQVKSAALRYSGGAIVDYIDRLSLLVVGEMGLPSMAFGHGRIRRG